MNNSIIITLLAATSFAASAALPHHNSDLITLENGYYSILYNCEKRGYEHYNYTTLPDTGNVGRSDRFFQDSRLPQRCQQTSTGTYRSHKGQTTFDRGHGIPSNHFDFNQEVSDSTFTMANVVPHQSSLNRSGLWRETDKLIECARDNGSVVVYGGVIWGDDESNDYFISSHGVTTPDYLYKIVILINGDRNAWIMPNNSEPKAKSGSKYRVTIAEIEAATSVTFDLPNKNIKQAKNLTLPKYCDLS